jgi:hypothetical protein
MSLDGWLEHSQQKSNLHDVVVSCCLIHYTAMIEYSGCLLRQLQQDPMHRSASTMRDCGFSYSAIEL